MEDAIFSNHHKQILTKTKEWVKKELTIELDCVFWIKPHVVATPCCPSTFPIFLEVCKGQ